MIIIDAETSGLDPERNSLLSLGAVDFSTGDEFYKECRIYPDTVIDDVSLGINGFTREQCVDPKKGLPYTVYMDFLTWAKGREPLLAGQQVASFDARFLQAIHAREGIIPLWPFGYRTVDLHSVAYARFGVSLNLDGILNALQLPSETKPHNALTGAKLEAQAFRLLFNR